MPSSSTVLSGTIAAPMDQVFALLSDPSRIPDWLPGCRAVGGASLMCRGAWLEVTFGRHTAAFEIIDFHPPFSFAWAEHGARAGSRTSFQLGFAGGTTAIRMKQVSPSPDPGLGVRLRAKVKDRRDPHRQLDQALQNLRKLTTA